MKAKRWYLAMAANQQAEESVERAIAMSASFPQDDRVLGSLYYDRAGIYEALGDKFAAVKAAERAWQFYYRRDPVGKRV
ncbi:hypothetical protein [Kribbella sp. NPDC006257]|uniref:hypothetical protein n=1 Tax=Kribbella sp. NPDC006257 TaxID=3156738 RepID=UPI0033BDF258